MEEFSPASEESNAAWKPRADFAPSGTLNVTRTAVPSSRVIGPESSSTRASKTPRSEQSVPKSSPAASPASTSPKGHTVRLETMDGSGPFSRTPSPLSGRVGSSSRTSRRSGTQIAGSTSSSATLPSWGSMLNGVLYELPTWERHTIEPEYGWLPTPTETANQLAPSMMKHRGCRNLSRLFPAGELCLIFEWLMGFPTGYSDARGSATLSVPQSPSGSVAAFSQRRNDG